MQNHPVWPHQESLWSWCLVEPGHGLFSLLMSLMWAFDGDKPQPGTHVMPSPLSHPGHDLGNL